MKRRFRGSVSRRGTSVQGSVLVISLVLMLLVFSLCGTMLAVAAARARASAREARRAQAMALAESAVAATQVALAAGEPASVCGALSTGQYSSQVTQAGGQARVRAVGRAKPLLGEAVTIALDVTLARRGAGWEVIAWRESQP